MGTTDKSLGKFLCKSLGRFFKRYRYITYLLRWQLSTPILALITAWLSFLGYWVSAAIANLVGAVLIFPIDNIIFRGLKMKKHKLVILEGCDKVGKTTVYQALRKSTEYGPLVIDRFIGSNIAHDIYYSRGRDDESLLMAEEALCETFDVYLVLLVCPTDILKDRIKKLEEGVDRDTALEQVEDVQDLFKTYFCRSVIQKKMTLDTSRYSVKQTVKLIKEFIGG